jgi:hypothetical protein
MFLAFLFSQVSTKSRIFAEQLKIELKYFLWAEVIKKPKKEKHLKDLSVMQDLQDR